MINAGDYSVPDWTREQDIDPMELLLQQLGDFVTDGMDDIVQSGVALLQTPLMLHNIMLANIMLVGLIQRQNDMMLDSQELGTTDLYTLASVGSVTSITTETFEQPMIMRGFSFSNGATAAGNLILSQSGPKTIGNAVNIYQIRVAASNNSGWVPCAQLIPAGNALTLTNSASNTMWLNADIRPLARYRSQIFRMQRNTLGQ